MSSSSLRYKRSEKNTGRTTVRRLWEIKNCQIDTTAYLMQNNLGDYIKQKTVIKKKMDF